MHDVVRQAGTSASMAVGLHAAYLALFDSAGELVAASHALRAWLHERPAVALELFEFAAAALRDGSSTGVVHREGAEGRLAAERLPESNALGAVLAVSLVPVQGSAAGWGDDYGLTRREREVAQLVMHGRSTAEIAAALRISAHTAKRHTEAVFRKLGVRRRSEVVVKLLRMEDDRGERRAVEGSA